jgi:hypothetical protein
MYIDEIMFISMKFSPEKFVTLDADFYELKQSKFRMEREWRAKLPHGVDLRKDQLNGQFREMVRLLANDSLLHDLVAYRIDIYYHNHTLYANEITLSSGAGGEFMRLKEDKIPGGEGGEGGKAGGGSGRGTGSKPRGRTSRGGTKHNTKMAPNAQ